MINVPRYICWTHMAVTILLMATSGLLASDGLPQDGAWARYFVQHKSSSGRERTHRITIRFVGTVVENSQKHRWVEWTNAEEVNGEDGKNNIRKRVNKFLIPEKALRQSSHPLLKFVRGWRGVKGKPVTRIKTGQREFYNGTTGANLLFLPGVLKPAKSVKRLRKIDHQKGQFRVKTAHAGTFSATWRVPSGKFVYVRKLDYLLWRHKDVPIGMAAMKQSIQITIKSPGQKTIVQDLGTTQISVEEWGTDAKSDLPKAR